MILSIQNRYLKKTKGRRILNFLKNGKNITAYRHLVPLSIWTNGLEILNTNTYQTLLKVNRILKDYE